MTILIFDSLSSSHLEPAAMTLYPRKLEELIVSALVIASLALCGCSAADEDLLNSRVASPLAANETGNWVEFSNQKELRTEEVRLAEVVESLEGEACVRRTLYVRAERNGMLPVLELRIGTWETLEARSYSLGVAEKCGEFRTNSSGSLVYDDPGLGSLSVSLSGHQKGEVSLSELSYDKVSNEYTITGSFNFTLEDFWIPGPAHAKDETMASLGLDGKGYAVGDTISGKFHVVARLRRQDMTQPQEGAPVMIHFDQPLPAQ